MLRTNLSTKPFYNERGVHIALFMAGLAVIALTVFNVTQIVLLSRGHAELDSRATRAEHGARDLRAHAVAVRQGINPKQLDASAGAAREANSLIGQRLFSWTDLLNRLETTLPDDVRITSMRPKIGKDGRVALAMTVVGRRVEDVDRFMDNLEATGSFADVFSREEISTEDGMKEVTIDGRYLPGPATPAKGAR
jgi:Tfp pilus assembly protein PilN